VIGSAWRWIRTRLKALRAFSFPLSGLPALIALAAVRPVADFDWGAAAVALTAVLTFHAAGNLLNDYFDFRAGVDSRTDGPRRPGRLLVRGELSPGEVLCLALAFLAVAAEAAAVLAVISTTKVLWFAGFAAIALYAYTGPPFSLKHRALGEPLVFVTFGPALMLGVSLAHAGRLHAEVLALSLPIGAATTAVLAANNLRDMAEDRQAGIRTLPLVLGRGAGLGVYVCLLIGALGGTAAVGLLTASARPLLAAPLLGVLCLPAAGRLLRGERLEDADVHTARFATALFAFVLLVMLLAGPLTGGG
jgi:1,4-dihydroxy-2-naphthoate octaprenyltransferase